MSAPEPTITEREARRREALKAREAFINGAIFNRSGLFNAAEIAAAARCGHPLPKVERPRKETLQDVHGMKFDFMVTSRHGGKPMLHWRDASCPTDPFTPAHTNVYHWPPAALRTLADLLERPTELVEDEEVQDG